MASYDYNRLNLLTKASQLPISLATAKSHLRVDHSDDDAYITALIWASMRSVEDYTKIALSDAQYSQHISEFPSDYIELLIGGVNSITGISYIDVNDQTITINQNDYYKDYSYNPARIYWKSSFSAPTLSKNERVIKIIFRAGNDISHDPLPYTIQQSLLLIIGHYYENRMDVVNTLNREIPMGSKWLLDGIKLYIA